MATIDAFLEYHKDPALFAAKMEEFNAAEQKAEAATAQAERDSAQAAELLRRAEVDRAELAHLIREFEAASQNASVKLAADQARVADLEARRASELQALMDERNQLKRTIIEAQAREGEAVARISDAKAEREAAASERAVYAATIAAMRAALPI